MTTPTGNTVFIDYGSKPPTPEFAKTGPHLRNYRRVYAASERAADETQDQATPLPAYLAMYETLGARHVVVKARDLETTFGFRIENEDVAAFCREHGSRFIGFAGVDPHKGMQDRIIFGSAYPMMPVDRCLAEIAALPLKDGVRRKWLQDNAARFLDLDR